MNSIGKAMEKFCLANGFGNFRGLVQILIASAMWSAEF